ncbi:very long chain fatty acid elongase 4-like [Ornithodoros turicata]|uniref:very long chain fatty acid elongase 4-like n=1 Tax=Ornithodoros turicata TaxID=34597 RepID=UPI003139EC9F
MRSRAARSGSAPSDCSSDMAVPPLMRIYEGYLWCLSFADRRTEKWFLAQSPLPVLAIIAVYLAIVFWGPRVMSKRQPFQLRPVLIIYNFSVASLNLYIALEILYCITKRRYSWLCQLVDYSDNEYEVRIARALWWYYMSKLIEMLDTVFFVLRKKDNQLTYLHIYHHSTMFFFWWIGVKWVAGGSAAPGPSINCLVHVLMYSYYGLTALGPKIQRYLWWKKYLTLIQLVQFSAGLGFGLNGILSGCKFTRWMQYAFVTYAFSFLLLFGNFYIYAYRSRNKARSYQLEKCGQLSQEDSDAINKRYALPALSTMCFPEPTKKD